MARFEIKTEFIDESPPTELLMLLMIVNII